jgi:hypothetical protein
MTTNPAENNPCEAILHPCPRLLIALHECAVKELQAILFSVRFTPTIVVNFPETVCCEYRETQFTGQRC